MSIADLPNELLLAIFENLVNSSSPSFADPPSRISEVCQHWRSQSLLIPDLRAVLPLVTVGTTSRTLKGPLNTGATLSFAMRGVSSRHKKDPDFLKVFAKSTQWGHVELLDLHHDMLRPISTQLVSDVPLLHTLKLNINAGEHDYAGYLYAFEEAPALRRLELECPARILFKAPFDQLEEYVERSTSSIGIGRILHPESKIQSLSYYSFPSTAAPFIISPSHEPIPSLTTLNLHLNCIRLDTLLATLTLPALTGLRVVSDSLHPVATVQALISRSRCVLETLSLRVSEPGTHGARTKDSHVPFLRECTELRNLELDHLEVSLFRTIMDPSTTSFLPYLQEFIAHIIPARPAFSGHRSVVPIATSSGSTGNTEGGPHSRRIPFVRLILPSAEERVAAHTELDGMDSFVQPARHVDLRLEETTRVLSGGPEVVRWWHTFSSSKKYRPKLNDAFSFLESGRGSAQDACQILVCLPVPFFDLRNMTFT
jgi:hypothetical protein